MPDRTSKPSPKPRFTKQMLSGSKSLSDLGVTAQSAKHPKGWTSAKGVAVKTDAALEELFSTDGVRQTFRPNRFRQEG